MNTRSKWSLAVAVAVLLCGSAATSAPTFAAVLGASVHAPKVGNLTGKVTDSKSKKPINGASVTAKRCVKQTCTSHSTKTGKLGNYMFKNIAVGSYSISVSASGYKSPTPLFASVSKGKTTHIDFGLRKPTKKSLKLSLQASPATPQVGQPGRITISLNHSVNKGTVTIHGTGPAVLDPVKCRPAKGSCGVDWVPAAAGNYQITASFSGNSNYKSVTSSLPVTVSKGAAAVTVSSTPTEPVLNQITSLKANISPGVGDGTVSFAATAPGGAVSTLSTCIPSGGTCSINWTPALPGGWTVTATWSGDGNYQAASNSAQLTVSAPLLPISLAIHPGTPVTGQSGTISGVLGQPVSDGTLTFSAAGPGGATFPATTCKPAQGTCSVQWQPSTPGTWLLTLQWSGDATYGPSTTTLTVLVSNPTTPLAITVAPSAPLVNQATVITVNIGRDVSDGTVSITGTGPGVFTSAFCVPSHGTCSIPWTPQAAGGWTLNAYWTGDANYPNGVGSANVTVNGNPIVLTLSANPDPVQLGHTLTVKATLNKPVSDGTVTFVAPSNSPYATKTCQPFQGNCEVSWQPATSGTWTISVTYSGDVVYSPVSSGITVTSTNAVMVASESPNPISLGVHGTFTILFQGVVSHAGTMTWTFTAPDKTKTIVNCVLSSSACNNPPAFVGAWSCSDLSYTTCQLHWGPTKIGTWTVLISWSDAQHHLVTTTLSVSVNAFVSFTANPNPIAKNGSTTLTGTLADNTINDGDIVFTMVGPNNAQAVIDCFPVVNGVCSQTWTPSASGSWTATARWDGDTEHPPSTTTIQITAM